MKCDLDQESIYQQVSKHILPTGIEYWPRLKKTVWLIHFIAII
ncbi:hypothetical protein PT276_06845 [Orbaceae bacterium ESL0721]|nr:hypothetical protein [Orbaceae bacterium ESL0721]